MESLPRFSLLLLAGSTLEEKICLEIKTEITCPVHIDVAREQGTFMDKLAQEQYDILLAEIAPELADPFELLTLAKTASRNTPFVFIGDPVYEKTALKLLDAGADDISFANKTQRLAIVIPRLVRNAQRDKEIELHRERLEKTVANLELVQSIAHIGTWEWDMQKDKLFWSGETYRLFGVEPGSVSLKKGLFLERMSPEERLKVSQILKNALKKNKPYEVEFHFAGADGIQRDIILKGKFLNGSDGKQTRMKGTLQDITERKMVADGCRQREYLLQKIIDSSKDMIYLKDRDSRMVLANKACEKLYNRTLDKIIGKTAREIFSDCDCAGKVLDDDRQIIQQNKALDTEERIRTQDGVKIFATSKVPWQNENGNVLGIVGVSHDITERKNLELALEKQRAELEEKNKLILDFFINISHEFKTPISALMLALELLTQSLKTDGMDGNLLYHTDVIRRNALRLNRLVENLLDITKIDAGFMLPKIELVDMVSLISDIVSSMESYTAQKGLELAFSSAADVLYVATDSQFIERIVLNVFSNAIKHTARGGNIKISLRSNADTFTITIRDNGIGIPEDKQSIIFDRFRQIETSFTRTNKGTGIGLAITKSLVELLGGSISLKSTVGVGSEFKICFPRTKTNDVHSIEKDYIKIRKKVETEFSDIDFK
jgi:PAS domain S-box-containing protein